MYARLGYQWASSLLGFIALACCAIPFVFWVWGAKIREKSRFAYAGGDEEGLGKKEEGERRAVEEELERQRSYVSTP